MKLVSSIEKFQYPIIGIQIKNNKTDKIITENKIY